jgi:hypothetical protein
MRYPSGVVSALTLSLSLSWRAEGVVADRMSGADELFFVGHFPHNLIVPTLVLSERPCSADNHSSLVGG